MSTKIKLNRIVTNLNRDRIDEKYDFFYLETCDKYIKRGAYILDIVAMNRDIKAVKFESGRKLLIMLERNSDNINKIKGVLQNVEEGSKYSIHKVIGKEIEDCMLVQILLNALAVYDTDFLKFNNLTGHLYCYHEDWLKHGKDKDGDIIWKIPTVEISVDRALCLHLDVRTFTSEKLKKKMTFTKKKFEDYPKYVFSAKRTLRRKLGTDTDMSYIMRQIDGTKTEIPFLDLQSEEKFAKTKMGVLQDIITNFNSKYLDLAKIEFDEVDILAEIEYLKKASKECADNIKSILEEMGICIVDMINDEYSKMFCKNITDILKDKYGITAEIGKRVKKDVLNICLIHNAEYYDGVNDPHDKEYAGYTVQHITFEDFADSSEFAIATVVHELLIKEDLKNGKISLFDWTALGFQDNVSFGMETEINDEKRYFFINVSPDGSFSINEQEFTLFEINEYTDCVNIFEDSRNRGETVKGIVKYADGQINVIKDSCMFTIPEVDAIRELLDSGDNKLRGKARRDELLSSVLDIKLFAENNCQFYFVGTMGDGMRVNIQRAAVIRKIEGYNNSEVMFDRLLPLMNVSFVHNGQLTVVPFPFKYLREHIATVNK